MTTSELNKYPSGFRFTIAGIIYVFLGVTKSGKALMFNRNTNEIEKLDSDARMRKDAVQDSKHTRFDYWKHFLTTGKMI